MNTRTTGIVITIIAVVLCGCPGLFICLIGAGIVAGLGTWGLNEQFQTIPSAYGLPIAGIGFLLIIIPIVAGIILLRGKHDHISPPNEPLPPAT